MANPITRTIFWFLVCAQLVFVVVAFALARPQDGGVPGHVPIMSAALVVISLITAVGSVLYRANALVRPIREGRIDPRSEQGLAAAFPPFMVNLALSESVGIYGVVLAILSGQAAWSIPFATAAVVLLVFHRPTAPALNPPPRDADRALDSTPIG